MPRQSRLLSRAAAVVAIVVCGLVGGWGTPAQAQTFNLAGIYTRIISFSVSPSQARTGTARCNGGDTVLNAGHHISTDQFFTHAVSSFPTSRPFAGQSPGHQWSVQVYNGGIAPITVTVTAICAPAGAFGPDGVVVARRDVFVPAITDFIHRVPCPFGRKTLGGGYEQRRASVDPNVERSYPSTSSEWSVRYQNSGEGVSVSTWAICYPAAAPITVKTASFAIGVFDAIAREGSATCDSGQKTLAGGFRPISLAVFSHLLYVLNAGGNVGDSDNITGFFLAQNSRLLQLLHATRRLSGTVTDPAQVSFSDDGRVLIVTEKATDRIDTYRLNKLGLASGPHAQEAPGSTTFGFALGKRRQVLVSEAFAGVPDGSALSSLTVDRRGRLRVISPSIGANQTAAYWVVVTNDGRFAFVTNTGSGTISSYSIAFDGTLNLLESIAGTTAGAVLDAALSNDGRYLYALSGNTGTIDAFEVHLDGTLTPLPGVSGLPIGSNGLAAR